MTFFKKNKQLLSACNGRCAPLSEIPDEAFSSGMLGGGVALFPASGRFLSPVNGRVESIAESLHAYTLRADDGTELLLHIGVDTVTLKGDGFRALVSVGDNVRAGAPLAEADLGLIANRGLSTATALLITNPEEIEIIEQRYGSVTAGRDAVLSYRTVQKG